MDQLTIACIPEVYPSVSETDQLSAMVSEVVAQAFRLSMQGAQIIIDCSEDRIHFRVCAPVKTLLLPLESKGAGYLVVGPHLHYGDSEYSFHVYDDSICFGIHRFDESVDKVQGWLNQLAVVERNLPAFVCREPSPLRVVN